MAASLYFDQKPVANSNDFIQKIAGWTLRHLELVAASLLLPIIRNTATGLQEIPTPVRESAAVLGLQPNAQLWKVFLPLASRTILAGIKTSAIIAVGTATVATLIGVGGLGEPIISGLNLNDTNTILQGAIPAALLALLVQFFLTDSSASLSQKVYDSNNEQLLSPDVRNGTPTCIC